MLTLTGQVMFVRRSRIFGGGSVMAFNRAFAPSPLVNADGLTSRMVGIGMNFAASPVAEPNIEDTILFASIEGMEKYDLRVLAVLLTWFGVHAAWVNADRLTKLVAAQSSPRVRAFWSAVARWQKKDRRFARLARLYVAVRRADRAFRYRWGRSLRGDSYTRSPAWSFDRRCGRPDCGHCRIPSFQRSYTRRNSFQSRWHHGHQP